MSDINPESTNQRLEDLEARLAFQEQALDSLTESLYALQQENQRLTIQVNWLADKARDLAGRLPEGAGEDDPPPPHY
jgi:SlyX protein